MSTHELMSPVYTTDDPELADLFAEIRAAGLLRRPGSNEISTTWAHIAAMPPAMLRQAWESHKVFFDPELIHVPPTTLHAIGVAVGSQYGARNLAAWHAHRLAELGFSDDHVVACAREEDFDTLPDRLPHVLRFVRRANECPYDFEDRYYDAVFNDGWSQIQVAELLFHVCLERGQSHWELATGGEVDETVAAWAPRVVAPEADRARRPTASQSRQERFYFSLVTDTSHPKVRSTFARAVEVGLEGDTPGLPTNFWCSLATLPDKLAALIDRLGTLFTALPIPPTLAQMIAMAIAYRSSCHICTLYYNGSLQALGVDEEVIRSCASDPEVRVLPPGQREMVRFALKVASEPERIGAADADALLDVGLTPEEIAALAFYSAEQVFGQTWETAARVPRDAKLAGVREIR